MACVPGMGRGMGASGRGEDKDAAGVEKEFRPRCARLREMVEDVKEVGLSLSLPPLTPASLSLCMNMSFCFVNRLLTIKSPDFLESGGLMNYGCYCSRHRETRLQKSLRRPQRCSITSMLKRGARKLRVAALVLRCLLLMERLKRVLGKGSGRERVWELARER